MRIAGGLAAGAVVAGMIVAGGAAAPPPGRPPWNPAYIVLRRQEQAAQPAVRGAVALRERWRTR